MTTAQTGNAVDMVQGYYEAEQPQAKPVRAPNRLLRYFALSDALALTVAFALALFFSNMVNHALFGRTLPWPVQGYGLMRLAQPGMIALGVLLWFQHSGHYRIRMPFWQESKQIISALSFAMLMDGFLKFAEKQDASRLWLMSSWIIAAFAIIALRILVRSHFNSQGRFQIRTLLVGSGKTAAHVNEALTSERDFGYAVAAQITNLPEAFLMAGASWEKLCAMYDAEHVVIALDGNELAASERQLAQLARESVPFSVSTPLRHMPVSSMVPQYFLNHDTILMTNNRELEQSFSCFLKRALDITVSGGMLLALSPLMGLIAFLVRGDGGPALFGHKRIGRDGRLFSCLKFRSMVMNGDAALEQYLAENPEAHEEWKATRKLQHDPRVTPLGRFLRKSSLDELPQLLNVLRGDMSLVGPRPIVDAEVENYDGDIAHYYRVRPGITGLWQVSGRNDVSYRQRVHMDSWYVMNWSFWHDIVILCKTVPALLKRQGAY